MKYSLFTLFSSLLALALGAAISNSAGAANADRLAALTYDNVNLQLYSAEILQKHQAYHEAFSACTELNCILATTNKFIDDTLKSYTSTSLAYLFDPISKELGTILDPKVRRARVLEVKRLLERYARMKYLYTTQQPTMISNFALSQTRYILSLKNINNAHEKEREIMDRIRAKSEDILANLAELHNRSLHFIISFINEVNVAKHGPDFVRKPRSTLGKRLCKKKVPF